MYIRKMAHSTAINELLMFLTNYQKLLWVNSPFNHLDGAQKMRNRIFQLVENPNVVRLVVTKNQRTLCLSSSRGALFHELVSL
jgi:hypothetical protein